ncbi:MAG: toll/interleukin-1 receptor domain-containing protein [Chlorobiaceae bacterium]
MPETSVFISYSRGDKEIARQIRLKLESVGMRVWIDEGELLAGDSLIQKISEGVGDADYLVALVSEYSIESEWCQKEISLAATDGIKSRRTKVIPVRVGDVEMPRTLADVVYLDFDTTRAEESAAKIVDDIRRQTQASIGHVAAQVFPTTSNPAPVSEAIGVSHLNSLEKRIEVAKNSISELLKKLDNSKEAAILVSLVPHTPGAASIDASKLVQLRQELSGRRVIPTSPHVGWLNIKVGRGRYELDGGFGHDGIRFCGADLLKDGSGSFAFMAHPISNLSTDETFALNDEVIVSAVLGGLWMLGEHAVKRALSDGPFDLRIEIFNAEDHSNFQLGHMRGMFGGGLWADTRPISSAIGEVIGVSVEELAEPSTSFMVVVFKLLSDLFQSFGVAECPQVDLMGKIRIRYWGREFVESLKAWAIKHDLQVTDELLPS